MTDIDFLYPDVLGAITGGSRVGMNALQFAVGAAPSMTYIGQPFEIVIVLQNMVDQAMEVRLSLGLPKRTRDGSPVNLTAPRNMVAMRMNPGEVGVARLPLVALLPTPQPLEELPIRVAVRQRVTETAHFVRAPRGGAPPSELAVTPFQLQALRDVPFVVHAWDQSPENVDVFVSIAPGTVPGRSQALQAKPRYTILWSPDKMPAERQRAASQVDEARFIASDLMADAESLAPSLLHGIDEAFAARGEPLKRGEGEAITKMMLFVLKDRSRSDPLFQLDDLRWFQTLCQVMAFDENAARRPAADLVMRYLFYAALYDAVLAAYGVLRPRLRIDLGDRAFRVERASRLLTWLAGHVEPDISNIYMPLALGGLVLHRHLVLKGEDSWTMVDDLREAYRQRVRLEIPEQTATLDLLDRLLTQAETDLKDRDRPT